MTVIRWPEIELFHNIRKHMLAYPELLNGVSSVFYRSKVKLHGTNSAIQCHKDGTVVPQSRTVELTQGNDNAGFSAWVKKTNEYWSVLKNDLCIFGEWVGPGVMKGTAVSQIQHKSFAVFVACSINKEENKFIVEPKELQEIVQGIPNTYVLPWYEKTVSIDWLSSDEELTKTVEDINSSVVEIEKCDPWVKTIFGIEGTGEGLVFYPQSNEHLGIKNFENLAYKAKGEKHRVIKAPVAVQLSAEIAENINQFVDMVLTEARLEQGTSAVGGFDKKLTGKFVAWVLQDVMKETQDELEASKLDWKQLQKPLSDKARSWYLSKS